MKHLAGLTDTIGRAIAWLTGVMGLATLLVVVLRYGLDVNTIALQDSVMYLHAICLMLAIPYALRNDEHVRVDVIYSRLGNRGKALVNCAGHLLFLLPCSLIILATSTGYALDSWAILEGAQEVGGIPATFALKTLIPVMALLLLLQGVLELVKDIGTLRRLG